MHSKASSCSQTLFFQADAGEERAKAGLSHPCGRESSTGVIRKVYLALQGQFLIKVDDAVSKVLPSPDWVVGVDSLSLCRGSRWLTDIKLHLHLTDLGILAGISYQSPVSPERRPVERITSNFPDDENSPFFNADNVGVKPFARLSFRKLRS